MTDYKKILRMRGIPTLLVSAILFTLLMGLNHYIEIRKDEEDAHKLMERELKIAVLTIMEKLDDTEDAIKDMEAMAAKDLEYPDRMFNHTKNVLNKSFFIQAAAIAFAPHYYQAKGRWFEPRCIRDSGKVKIEQIGGEEHDYLKMDWYTEAMDDTTSELRWSDPYIDHSQKDTPIMSLTRPLYNRDEKRVAVLCIDVSLVSLKQLLKKVEPYPGSVCQLLNEDGEVMVSSRDENEDEDNYEDKDFFTETMVVRYEEDVNSSANLQIRLSCPRSAIYSSTTTLNLITLGLLLLGILLLAYIVRRVIDYMVRLYAAQQQQQTVESELRIAHDIQMKMLRNDFPVNLWAELQPMKEVGGDLYDFYQKDETLFFIIGDVSGKGLPAAMMMAGTMELFRMAARHFHTPKEIVSEINRVLSERNPRMIFVTAFVGKIDKAHELLTYCNAGHNPPILNGQLLNTDPDIPMGFDADYSYRQQGATFAKDSRIVLYTDGITEARNNNRKFLGAERLRQIASNYLAANMEGLAKHIITEVHRFMNGTEKRDDITLMCITNDGEMLSPTMTITNDVSEVARVKSLLREYCICIGAEHRQTMKITLAVEEALSNVINYAYPEGTIGSIEVDFKVKSTETESNAKNVLTITIADSGEAFNPLAGGTADAEQIVTSGQVGGLGIMLYQKIMDNVTYERTEDGRNILTMTKEINKQ